MKDRKDQSNEIGISGVPESESFIKLTQAILDEINRIFPCEESWGTTEGYAWLLQHYGVTEEEDVIWQFFLVPEDAEEELSEEDQDDKKILDILYDEDACLSFLNTLLEKYRSNTKIYTP